MSDRQITRAPDHEMPASPWFLQATALEARLRRRGTRARAVGSRAYLKSDLEFTGNDTATLRQEVRGWHREHPDATLDSLFEFAEALWRRRVFELRLLAAELVVPRANELEARHLVTLERWLRESHTWALVDVIAPRLTGNLLDRKVPGVGRTLDRWAKDADFWIRRAALLSLLLPMRQGRGDWRRFTRYADPLLEDREFFIRKAIGWLLREAATRSADRVVAFVEPRAPRLSGVTWREAVRKLPPAERRRLERLRVKPALQRPQERRIRPAGRHGR